MRLAVTLTGQVDVWHPPCAGACVHACEEMRSRMRPATTVVLGLLMVAIVAAMVVSLWLGVGAA